MAWIESHQEMARHPKTRRVALRLGISKAAVIGHLHLLWWWTLDFAPDGDLSGFDAEEVAAVAEWEGDAEQFLQALLDTGWLDEGRRVHNWGDYAGRLVTAREGIRERQRRFREKKRDVPPSRGDVVAGVLPSQGANVAAMSEAFPDDVTEVSQPCNGGVTVTSPLRNADVTVMSPLRNATQNSTEQNLTEQNRTQPNRERVARGRAGGPAERSGGVHSLSRSRELVSDGDPAPAGGEARRGADSGFAESAASGEAERLPDGAGNALPPDSGDLREKREPRREDGLAASGDGGRGSSRGGELGPGGSRVPLPVGGEFPPGEGPGWTGGDSSRDGDDGRRLLPNGGERLGEGGEVSRSGANSLPAGMDASFDDERLSYEVRESLGREGDASPAHPQPLRESGRALPGIGPLPMAADLLPAEGEVSFDPERLSSEVRESLLAGAAALEDGGRGASARGEAFRVEGEVAPLDVVRSSEGAVPSNAGPSGVGGKVAPGALAAGGTLRGAGGRSASVGAVPLPNTGGLVADAGRCSAIRGGTAPDDGDSSRDVSGFLSGGGEEIRMARALSSARGEPYGEGEGSRPKVAALRVAAEDFLPAGGASVGVASAGGALPGGESFAAGGGDAPPMGEEAREALRQDVAFREAWRGWRLHLADLGRPVMSRGQERALLRECARRGPARAVEVISYSITKGAKNLIWDDAPRARRSQQPAAARARVPNPEGWPEWLAAEYPDRAGIDYADAPESVQGEFRRALQKTG